jgi:hypothetical protein
MLGELGLTITVVALHSSIRAMADMIWFFG